METAVSVSEETVSWRYGVLLSIALVPFAPYIFGVLTLDWGFNELSAIFFVAAFAVGFTARLRVRETTVAYLKGMDTMLSAALMVPVHMLLHVVVPSDSGQAALTMPIRAPLADLLGFPRAVAVMAYQTGAPTLDRLIPTNGALLAMLLAAGVPYPRWLRFAVPGALLVVLVGLIGMAVALAIS